MLIIKGKNWLYFATLCALAHAAVAQTVTHHATDEINQGKSVWVYKDSNGKLVYKLTPAGDKIMDFSYAGYMGGGVPLPVVPTKITVVPSGGNDDSRLIQSAINSVSVMPLIQGFRGAVLLSPGVFPCSSAITIAADGVVLRGSGSGKGGTIIKMGGGNHTAVVISNGIRQSNGPDNDELAGRGTVVSDTYVPAGSKGITVADGRGFAVGDRIAITRKVTAAWVHLLKMDSLKRDDKPQIWMKEGSTLTTHRTIQQINRNRIVLDIPLSDCLDSKYTGPAGTFVIKVPKPSMIEQAGFEKLHIMAPPMRMSYQQAPYKAIQINGRDCWANDIFIEETMNSVAVGGERITLERVVVTRTVPNLGASKPAEFAPNASQLLLDRCSSTGDNIWHAATGAGQTGPIVILNCSFGGNGHIEGHQRWTTGLLLDNCRLPDGGIDFKNRGSMGSGHGWGTAWSVAWNCQAKSFVIQQPPGAYNWMIGCVGPNVPTAQPFNSKPFLLPGVDDSPDHPVSPRSLYIAQLFERLGGQAVAAIGYNAESPDLHSFNSAPGRGQFDAVTNKEFGVDVAAHKYANPSNIRNGDSKYGGERAIDADPDTYWSTDDQITTASLEIDLEDPCRINRVEIREAKALTGRVQAFMVEGMVDSEWKILTRGTIIGDRIVAAFRPVLAWKVRLTIISSTASPAISQFSLYPESSDIK